MNASNPLITRDAAEAPEPLAVSGSPCVVNGLAELGTTEAAVDGTSRLIPHVPAQNEDEPLRDIVGNFSLSHLSAFMTALECGRVSAASAMLRRSHSAISRSIALLEHRFKCTLLARSPAGVKPTSKGEVCNARCQIIRRELFQLRDRLISSGHVGLRRRATALFRMHVDVSRLRAIVAVHDFGSVQNAAHFLAVSQPAISSSISSLEKDLDIALFVRTPRGMIATPAGVSAAFSFKRILSELRKIEDDTASVDGDSSGLVCVGGLAYSRNALLPKVIKQVLANFPQIVVRTVEGPIDALLMALHAGDVDVIICAHPDPALLEGVRVEPLLQDWLQLFVFRDHPLAGRKNLSARDVIQYPFILPPIGSITRKLLDRAFQKAAGRTPEGFVETSSYTIIRKLLVGTHQVCFRSVSEFSYDLRDRQIVQLDVDFDLPSREICLLQRKGAVATNAVCDVIKTIRQTAACF